MTPGAPRLTGCQLPPTEALDTLSIVFGIVTPLAALGVAIASAIIAYQNRTTARDAAGYADRSATASESSAAASDGSLRLATAIDERQQASESSAQRLHELSVLERLMEVVGNYERSLSEQSLTADPHMSDVEFNAWFGDFRRLRSQFHTRVLALSLQVPDEEALAQAVSELITHAEQSVELRSQGEIPRMYINLQVELSWVVGRFNVAITEAVARRMGADDEKAC